MNTTDSTKDATADGAELNPGSIADKNKVLADLAREWVRVSDIPSYRDFFGLERPLRMPGNVLQDLREAVLAEVAQSEKNEGANATGDPPTADD